MAKVIRGEFSQVAGSNVRRIYDENGAFLGTVTKMESGEGYRIWRYKDSKVRTKRYLADAYKSIAREN